MTLTTKNLVSMYQQLIQILHVGMKNSLKLLKYIIIIWVRLPTLKSSYLMSRKWLLKG